MCLGHFLTGNLNGAFIRVGAIIRRNIVCKANNALMGLRNLQYKSGVVTVVVSTCKLSVFKE